MVAEEPWAVATSEIRRLRVRVVVTSHRLCGLRRGARLFRHGPGRGGGLVLLVSADLTEDEALDACLRALSAISQRAWRMYGRTRRADA